MSVSFTYRPTNPSKGVSFAAGSNLNKAFENAYGSFPIILSKKDTSILRGFVACGYDDVEELITAICEFGEVEVQSHW